MGIKKEKGGVHTLGGSLGMALDGHQLHAQRAADAIVAGHDEKKAVGQTEVHPRWDDDLGKAVAESGLEVGDESDGIKVLTHFGLGKDAHRATSYAKSEFRVTAQLARGHVR